MTIYLSNLLEEQEEYQSSIKYLRSILSAISESREERLKKKPEY